MRALRPIADYIEGSIIRRAKKAHNCYGAPHCEQHGIKPGETYIEYVGEVSAYQSGARYCLTCAESELVRSELIAAHTVNA